MNEEIEALQAQLAEVKRQKSELKERMRIEATLKVVNEIEMDFYKSKIKVFYNYLNDIQNSGTNMESKDLISYLFTVLDVNVVLD